MKKQNPNITTDNLKTSISELTGGVNVICLWCRTALPLTKLLPMPNFMFMGPVKRGPAMAKF